ncbi:MAG: hypothetical protein L3J28_12860 [Candidatus Polarisedimenticolaceae bacterium]|nr:hypothetical protein [Candidatus Polarisedimenticolaceae bacterium]
MKNGVTGIVALLASMLTPIHAYGVTVINAINFSTFQADSGITISVDSSLATLNEQLGKSSVLLVNDPGVGDAVVMSGGTGSQLIFDYELTKNVGDNDEFGFFLIDSATGSPLSVESTFYTKSPGVGTVTISLAEYASVQLGMQFQLVSLPNDQATTATVAISNLRTEAAAYGPISDITLTSDIPSPQQAGSSVTFTAQAEGGDPTQYEYQFKRYGPDTNSRWVTVQDYSASSTYVMATSEPASVGGHAIKAFVRTVGATADAQDVYKSWLCHR